MAKARHGFCISEKYNHVGNKLIWKCSNGHTWLATPYKIDGGTWCPYCAGNIPSTLKEMKEIAQKRGGECLSYEYFNSATKLKWQCSKGHTWEAKPTHIKNGSWCPRCRGRYQTIEDMKSLANKRGGFCLSDQYLGANKHLLWKCSNGHFWKATPSNVKRGTWCPECSISTRSEKKKKYSIQDMKDIASLKGGDCLSDFYVNTQTKLKWRCSEGHEWETVPSSILRGSWCRICALNKNAAKRRGTIQDMRKIAEKRNGKCLSTDYIDSHTKLLWSCSNNHIWEATPASTKNGKWCPTCKKESN